MNPMPCTSNLSASCENRILTVWIFDFSLPLAVLDFQHCTKGRLFPFPTESRQTFFAREELLHGALFDVTFFCDQGI